jgi:uncharacterized membrane protein
MDDATQSFAYHLMHFVHLLALVAWAGAAAASDGHLARARSAQNADDRRKAATAARRITLILEMPLVTFLVVAGLVMAVSNLDVFKQSWFHMKLALVFLVLVLFGLASARQKDVNAALAGQSTRDVSRAFRSYRLMRWGSIVALVALLYAVTFRFGSAS